VSPVPVVSAQTFRKLSWIVVALGLLIMVAMFIWSFHIENDFTARYGTNAFSRQFWITFFAGTLLYVVGCVGLGATIAIQNAAIGASGAMLAGVALFQVGMPRVDFEGWTGAATYVSSVVLFSGGMLMLAVVGARYLWRKFHASYSRASF
jgi:hypothetical protein